MNIAKKHYTYLITSRACPIRWYRLWTTILCFRTEMDLPWQAMLDILWLWRKWSRQICIPSLFFPFLLNAEIQLLCDPETIPTQRLRRYCNTEHYTGIFKHQLYSACCNWCVFISKISNDAKKIRNNLKILTAAKEWRKRNKHGALSMLPT